MSTARRLSLLAVLLCAACHAADPPLTAAKLGINVDGLVDWNTELPFVDEFRLARAWISQKPGEKWGNGPKLSLDEHGWITKLEPGCYADTPLFTSDGNHYPPGDYTVLYDGVGTIDTWGSAKVKSRENGKVVFSTGQGRGGFWIKLTATDPTNYVRNIRVVMPGFEETYAKQLFNPTFLKRWQGVACLRFMDWMRTNGNQTVHWADRAKVDDASWTTKGAPVEIMCELANRLQADAWFCLPAHCDDDYVTQFAKLVKAKLDPARKVYLEYSNEVWNSMFEQHRYAEEMGKQLKLGEPKRPWEGAGMYYSRRSGELFKLWEDAWGNRDRLVRVVAWQAGGAWWSEHIILPAAEIGKHCDALAIAPYITFCIGPQTKPLNQAEVEGWDLDKLFAHLEAKALPESLRWVAEQKKIADQYGLKVVGYEGGQHLVGVGGGENSKKMEELFHRANADPRMGALYDRYLSGWSAAGGDLFCYFASCGVWSKWGSWGAVQYGDEDASKSAKYQALVRWAKACGQRLGGG